MPAMLQLLQSKQFGTHRLPEGWVIAAAGNAPQYNQSARLFDTATMDRVRLLEIEESYPVWRSYAHARGLHPAILAYLELNRSILLRGAACARAELCDRARLGGSLRNALQLRTAGLSIEEGLFGEFFAASADRGLIRSVFRLFSACREQLDVTAVLSGASAEAAPALRALRFDGRLAAVEFLLHTLTRASLRNGARTLRSRRVWKASLPRCKRRRSRWPQRAGTLPEGNAPCRSARSAALYPRRKRRRSGAFPPASTRGSMARRSCPR